MLAEFSRPSKHVLEFDRQIVTLSKLNYTKYTRLRIVSYFDLGDFSLLSPTFYNFYQSTLTWSATLFSAPQSHLQSPYFSTRIPSSQQNACHINNR